MVKKLQKMAAKKNAKTNSPLVGALGSAIPASLLDGHLAQSIKDSAQQIWAAGLGAFSKAQGEGGKVFEALVKEGVNLQKKTQSAAEEKLGGLASKVTGMAGDVGSKAGQQWDKLESIFEERVARALKRLGVPSAKDVAELVERLNALSDALGVPAKPKAAAKASKPATKVAAKTAAKAPAAKPVKAAAKAVVKAPVKAAAKPAAKPAAKKVAAKAAPAAAPAAKAPVKRVARKAAAPAAAAPVAEATTSTAA